MPRLGGVIAMSDLITITGIRAIGFHGVLEFERTSGQEFIVDISLEVNTADAAKHDDLQLTVDYGDVAQRVHGFITGDAFQLIETLANRIADDLLTINRVLGVTVTVHKPQAPIPLDFDDVAVTITRKR